MMYLVLLAFFCYCSCQKSDLKSKLYREDQNYAMDLKIWNDAKSVQSDKNSMGIYRYTGLFDQLEKYNGLY